MTTSVIVAGARTPIGRLMGSLKDFSGSDLGAVAIRAALETKRSAQGLDIGVLIDFPEDPGAAEEGDPASIW